MNRYFTSTYKALPFVSRGNIKARALGKKQYILFWTGAVLLTLTVTYVILTNMVAASAFKLRDERVRIEELLLQNKKAETALANRETISRLEEEARRIGLVPIGRVKFVESSEGTVVLK